MNKTGTKKNNGKQLCENCFRAQNKNSTEPEELICSRCGIAKLRTEYHSQQWNSRAKIRTCRTCKPVQKSKGIWMCCRGTCRKQLPKDMFDLWITSTKSKTANGRQVCNECFKEDQRVEDALRKRTQEHVHTTKKSSHPQKKMR